MAKSSEPQHSPVPGEHSEAKLGKQPVSRDLENGTRQLQTIASAFNKRLKFHVHEDTNRIFVQVIDSKTNEVIREVPPKELLDMLAKIYEVVGLLVDERV